MRERCRTHVGVVHEDLERTLVRNGNSVIAISHMEAEVLYSAIVEIRRNPHIDRDRIGTVGLKLAGLGEISQVIDLLGTHPTRSVVRLTRRGNLQLRDMYLFAIEEITLQRESH